DAERLLAAVLYEHKLGTRQVLADAFRVSLGTLRECCLFDLEWWRSNAISRSGDLAVAGA
ncbi:hypothetical protein, partial [Streptomyces sp. NPDC004250]|uniref:hypothetical protein n=1 Tax=Streptomyces sp. NPDC004250 TaxID=3364692 RepID=UPI00367C9DA6